MSYAQPACREVFRVRPGRDKLWQTAPQSEARAPEISHFPRPPRSDRRPPSCFPGRTAQDETFPELLHTRRPRQPSPASVMENTRLFHPESQAPGHLCKGLPNPQDLRGDKPESPARRALEASSRTATYGRSVPTSSRRPADRCWHLSASRQGRDTSGRPATSPRHLLSHLSEEWLRDVKTEAYLQDQ